MPLDVIFDFLSKLVGAAGFGLSLFLAISGFLKNRQSFDVSVIDYRDFGKATTFFLSIVNKSQSPLVITEVTYLGTVCELEPKRIRNDPQAWNGVTTPRFPICIPARSAQCVYLEFVGRLDPQHIPLTADIWVTLQIQTISHKELRTLLLGPPGHYLHLHNNR